MRLCTCIGADMQFVLMIFLLAFCLAGTEDPDPWGDQGEDEEEDRSAFFARLICSVKRIEEERIVCSDKVCEPCLSLFVHASCCDNPEAILSCCRRDCRRS